MKQALLTRIIITVVLAMPALGWSLSDENKAFVDEQIVELHKTPRDGSAFIQQIVNKGDECLLYALPKLIAAHAAAKEAGDEFFTLALLTRVFQIQIPVLTREQIQALEHIADPNSEDQQVCLVRIRRLQKPPEESKESRESKDPKVFKAFADDQIAELTNAPRVGSFFLQRIVNRSDECLLYALPKLIAAHAAVKEAGNQSYTLILLTRVAQLQAPVLTQGQIRELEHIADPKNEKHHACLVRIRLLQKPAKEFKEPEPKEPK